MNLNDFARGITLQEGLKKSVNIGQVKEIIKLVLIALAKMNGEELHKLLERYNK